MIPVAWIISSVLFPSKHTRHHNRFAIILKGKDCYGQISIRTWTVKQWQNVLWTEELLNFLAVRGDCLWNPGEKKTEWWTCSSNSSDVWKKFKMAPNVLLVQIYMHMQQWKQLCCQQSPHQIKARHYFKVEALLILVEGVQMYLMTPQDNDAFF